METFPPTWMWMAIALVVLAANLVFPRSQRLKVAALAFLGLSTLLHAFVSFILIEREVNMYIVQGQPVDLRHGFLAHMIVVEVFGVALALILGILFLFIPADVFTTTLARFHRRA